eukprot:CAMPEP_0203902914 /NCGR_PEP_ID=MMETSP0359-20131031/44914_1 /ASSEMBLY_ACC=CAM_ASM_000338 /TAXON_ID=268821 /ORGANISM="Scrippsiella Hangoei, Strain SHTV-5" /LENGTH=66 /DNA_ID=CAMNT_0050826861 /DNA_START=10 /DNA_END=207 /DNA_ORIENTATION=-
MGSFPIGCRGSSSHIWEDLLTDRPCQARARQPPRANRATDELLRFSGPRMAASQRVSLVGAALGPE